MKTVNLPPSSSDLSTLYPDASQLKIQKQRYTQLIDRFTALYNSKPDFICRAPGRVNIIGEHIDYMGYGVLPMAIERVCMNGLQLIAIGYFSCWQIGGK